MRYLPVSLKHLNSVAYEYCKGAWNSISGNAGYQFPEWSYTALGDGVTHYRLTTGELSLRNEIVVMIHGMASSADACFRHLAGELERLGYPTMIYDLYGRGRSSPTRSGRYDQTVFVRQLQELIVTLGLDRATRIHVVGYSLGAGIGALFTCEHRKLVSSLTLVGPVGHDSVVPRQSPRPIALALASRGVPLMRFMQSIVIDPATRVEFENAKQPLANHIVGNLNWQAAHNKVFYGALYDTAVTFPFVDMQQCYRECKTAGGPPVLVMLATKDKKIPFVSNYEFYCNLVGEAFVVVVENCGHWFVLERNSEVASMLDQFFRRRAVDALPHGFHKRTGQSPEALKS